VFVFGKASGQLQQTMMMLHSFPSRFSSYSLGEMTEKTGARPASRFRIWGKVVHGLQSWTHFGLSEAANESLGYASHSPPAAVCRAYIP
jgi:hypothetical protein